MTTLVAVAIGSNLGDRASHLAFARRRLASELSRFRMSSVRETTPVDVPEPQPRYLNAVAIGETVRSPRELLSTLQAIERERGRERPFAGSPRTLDLDLVLFGDLVLDEPGLILPHPRFHQRRFVLEPLAEIAPGMIDPVTGKAMRELLDLVLAASATPRRRTRAADRRPR